ncbi:MAG: HAMP domain-containing histidine kinase, partial [Acidobacteria bacterium]|nr:HAMP domain-containing histidine kinase [Acidobacteriota bacterium]
AHEKYTALKKLFLKTRDQWGYPGSRENTRAQLYWIRSMLKWCCQSENKTPIERLNQWFVTGKKVANGSGILELDSIQILQHFIIHPVPFLRVKTIQYFQKFIFSLKKEKGPIEKLIFDDELVKTMSNSVISVLKMYRTEPGEGSPSWFEMEAVRFFAWMILNYRYTGLCPARLCYDIWESNISSTFPFRLADFIQICPKGLEDKIEISKMLHAAGQLMQKMKRENSQVIEILPELMRFCQSCRNHTLEEEKCPCKNNFGHEFAQFFTAIEKLLSLTKIEHFKNTPNFNEVLGLTLNYFKGKGIIEAFARLSRYLSQYYHEKSQDIYYLNVIKFPTFYQVKKSLENIRDMIDKSQKKTSWLENALYNRIWIQWHNILKNELDNGLILDFANAIQYYKDTQLIDNESIDMELIFKNIFTRLNMMAECDRSYLIYIEKKNNQLVILHNDGENEFTLSNKSYQLKDMPLEWLEPDTFIVLAENDIKQYINGNHAHIFIKSPGIVPQKNNALYLVFWNRINDTGLSRLKSHEIIGEFITTVALLQVAMEEQREQKEEFFRIVSHELNQIIRGLLSWMSNLTAGYLEDDPAMRLEYYERFQSSLVAADHVIRSLLTFRDSSVFDIKACYLDKEIEQVVKNARVQYKDYGNITLNFHKETGDYEIITEPALVGTAIMNLLTNSRKYNPEKNPVNLMLKTVDQKIVIEVKDEGIGIPPSDYPFIFQLFKRGSLAVKKNIDGLGVGLAISKKNIESLGGVIDFDSKVGVGTTFRIILNKRKFDKRHLLVTRVTVKKAPDFSAVKDIEKRKKFLEKVEYNPNKNILILRGILTDEEYNDLKMCYLDDEKTKEFHLEALQKLHRESLFNLNKITTIK